jgi:tetratricopeptide (TPR) repeat protein
MTPESTYRLLSSLSTAGAVICAAGLALLFASDFRRERHEGAFAAHMEAGEQSFRAEQFQASAESFAAAADLEPNSAVAWTFLGNALLAWPRHPEALIAYDRALLIEADHVGALLGRAMANWLSGTLDAAERDYRRLIELDPDKHLYYYQLDKVLLEQRKYRESADLWLTAMERHRGHAEWNARGTIVNALVQARDWEQVRFQSDKGYYEASTDEDRTTYRYHRGVAANRLGNSAAAFIDLEAVWQARPEKWPVEQYLQLFQELVYAAAAIGDTPKADEYAALFEQNNKDRP